MDIIKVIPKLLDLMKRKKIALNINNLDNILTISIINKRNIFGKCKIISFRNKNHNALIADINKYINA